MRKAYVAQGLQLADLPYKALWYPYGAWFVVAINIFLVIISGYETFIGGFDYVNFIFNYVVILIFVVLFIFWKLYKKTKWVKLMEMDLVSGRRDDLHPVDPDEGRKIGPLLKTKRVLFG